MDGLEPLADLGEGLAEALFEGALELLVHGGAHLVQLLLVALAELADLAFELVAEAGEVLLLAGGEGLGGGGHGLADLLAQRGVAGVGLGAGAVELVAQQQGAVFGKVPRGAVAGTQTGLHTPDEQRHDADGDEGQDADEHFGGHGWGARFPSGVWPVPAGGIRLERTRPL